MEGALSPTGSPSRPPAPTRFVPIEVPLTRLSDLGPQIPQRVQELRADIAELRAGLSAEHPDPDVCLQLGRLYAELADWAPGGPHAGGDTVRT